MKKLLLAALFAGALIPARAVYLLPEPWLLSESQGDGNVVLTWQLPADADPDEKVSHYHVIVYKKHKAVADERFTLAETDFSYIESAGTMTRHEERGAVWDYLPDCPGWYVKFPQYMNQAMGIDAFQNFVGSDNDDIFGGSYMLSPDYDLLGVSVPNRRLNVSCQLANEAVSVSGGFALYTWSDDWWSVENYDYKPVGGHDHHFDNLSNTSFQDFEEECVPEIFVNRTRLSFYGKGYSAFWVNRFKVDMPLSAGDEVGYPAEIHVVEAQPGENTFTIDTSADTENDYTYGYILRTAYEEYDDYRELTTIRFLSACPQVRRIGDTAIEDVAADAAGELKVAVSGGMLAVEGVAADTRVEVFDLSGRLVATGTAAAPIAIDTKGVLVVRAAGSAAKVAL